MIQQKSPDSSGVTARVVLCCSTTHEDFFVGYRREWMDGMGGLHSHKRVEKRGKTPSERDLSAVQNVPDSKAKEATRSDRGVE